MERLRLYRDRLGMAHTEEELAALADAIAATVAAVADDEAGGGPAASFVLLRVEGRVRLKRRRRERKGICALPIGEEARPDDA